MMERSDTFGGTLAGAISPYDSGDKWRNFEEVFGKRSWRWMLPLEPGEGSSDGVNYRFNARNLR